jgi:hypothetical protein
VIRLPGWLGGIYLIRNSIPIQSGKLEPAASCQSHIVECIAGLELRCLLRPSILSFFRLPSYSTRTSRFAPIYASNRMAVRLQIPPSDIDHNALYLREPEATEIASVD